MTETSDAELDVDDLMNRIREAAARREARGNEALVRASARLYHLLATKASSPPRAEFPRLSLQPEFTPHREDRYHIDDLLKYHDQNFVRNAYRAILKREPDQTGFDHHLENLRAGRFNKIDVLAGLRYSPEGESKEIRITGLRLPALVRRLYSLPALGYLLQLLIALARLPVMVRHQRQYESYSLAQQQLLADHISDLGRASEGRLNDLARAVAEARDEGRNIASLQHQQIGAVVHEQKVILDGHRKHEDEVATLLAGERASFEAQLETAARSVEDVSRRLQQIRAELTLQQRRLMTPEKPGLGSAEHSRERGPEIIPGEPGRRLDALWDSLEEHFRGGRAEIKERFKVYLPFLRESGASFDILDVGCGRGEWLELLREEGLRGRGVDANRVKVEECRERGLDAAEGDALKYLRGLPDASLRAVTCFHLVEHLPFETLIALVDEIVRTLRPGGVAIFETPNPENVLVGSWKFYLDPSHRNPLPSETLTFLLQARGLLDPEVIKLHPTDSIKLREDSELAKRFNYYFYGPMDYAVVARRI